MKLLHSFCDPIETMPTVTSYNGRFIDSEGTHYYDLMAGKGCNVLGFNNEYVQYHVAHAHRTFPSNDWNAKPEIWNKLETALDIIMEHFSETEDRIAELEEELESLKNGIKETSR